MRFLWGLDLDCLGLRAAGRCDFWGIRLKRGVHGEGPTFGTATLSAQNPPEKCCFWVLVKKLSLSYL